MLCVGILVLERPARGAFTYHNVSSNERMLICTEATYLLSIPVVEVLFNMLVFKFKACGDQHFHVTCDDIEYKLGFNIGTSSASPGLGSPFGA